MRISDWSSDVCSSDLCGATCAPLATVTAGIGTLPTPTPSTPGLNRPSGDSRNSKAFPSTVALARRHWNRFMPHWNFVASGLALQLDRTSVVLGKRVSGRVDLGGSRLHQQKKNK